LVGGRADRQQAVVMVAPGHLPRFIAQTPHRLFEMNPGDMGGLAEKRECGAHLSSRAGRPLERPHIRPGERAEKLPGNSPHRPCFRMLHLLVGWDPIIDGAYRAYRAYRHLWEGLSGCASHGKRCALFSTNHPTVPYLPLPTLSAVLLAASPCMMDKSRERNQSRSADGYTPQSRASNPGRRARTYNTCRSAANP